VSGARAAELLVEAVVAGALELAVVVALVELDPPVELVVLELLELVELLELAEPPHAARSSATSRTAVGRRNLIAARA
jgi:hypothetical protein